MSPREKISENTRIPVALTARERELILEHTFAGDELLALGASAARRWGGTQPNKALQLTGQREIQSTRGMVWH